MSGIRLTYLDVIRGIGIILVVLSHSTYPSLMSWANGFFMPLFYIVSGFLDKTDSNCFYFSRCIYNKSRRLLVPYLFWSVLISIFTFSLSTPDFIGILYSRPVLFKDGFENNIVLLNNYLRPLWFLTSMFTSYVVYYLVLKANKPIRLFLLLVCIVITIGIKYIPILLPWSIDTAFMGALYIFAGRKIREYDCVLSGDKNIPIVLISITLYVLLHIVNGAENMSISLFGRFAPFSFICGICGTFFLLSIIRRLERSAACSPIWGGVERLLSWIGKNSLVVFCIHFPILIIIEALLRDRLNTVLIAFIQVFFSVMIGGILNTIMRKRIPFSVGEK